MDAFDVAIVGARVSGSVTAALLGEAGYRVLLVDSARFPRETISTHFFRGAGLGSVLVRLGVLDTVLALGSPPLTCEYDYEGTDPTPEVAPPQDPGALGYALSCRRGPLDALLLDRARRVPGVEIWEGATARQPLVRDDRVIGLVLERDGVRHDVGARLLVGADGRASSVARWVDAPIERRETATRALYFRYLRGFRGPGGSWDGAEFSVVGDEMAYVFPGDDDVACLAVSVNLEVFGTFRGAVEASFDERIARHPGLAERYAAATPDGRLLGSGPADALVRRPFGPGWALVGDASMNQDPWTGLGMDNAGVHATFLADAVDRWLSGRLTEAEAFGEYRDRRDAHAMEDFAYTAEFGRDLARLVDSRVAT